MRRNLQRAVIACVIVVATGVIAWKLSPEPQTNTASAEPSSSVERPTPEQIEKALRIDAEARKVMPDAAKGPFAALTHAQASFLRKAASSDDEDRRSVARYYMARLGPQLQKEFVDDLRVLCEKDPDNEFMQTILYSWIESGGIDTVDKLAADKSQALAGYAQRALTKDQSYRVNVLGI